MNPNNSGTVIRTSALGAAGLGVDQFYYSIDFVSTIVSLTGDSSSGSTDSDNFTVDIHLEGIGTVTAVPEASTYGMMLAGLGLVGFAVRRRNLA